MNRKSLFYYLLLVFGILVLINILSNRFFFRIDLTEDQRYTLSQTTLDLLADLQEPVTITAYFSEGLQPQFDQVRRDFKDLLTEYASHSGNQVVYEFINPNKDEISEQQAAQAGIQPLIISSREKDQSVQKRAFMGAIIQLGEENEVIPFINPQGQMEYVLTTALKKLSIREKPLVGIIGGHGEASMSAMPQVMDQLGVLFQPEPVWLSDTVVLSKYKTLAIVNPVDTFPEYHLKLLTQYLQQGGNIFMALNRVDVDLQRATATERSTGIEQWLLQYGITVKTDMVLDANCGAINVQQQQGPFTFNTSIDFPYLPVISQFAGHPITEGLSGVLLQFASSLNFSGDSTLMFTPLAFTSEKSATEAVPAYFNLQRQWSDQDFPLQKIAVAGLLEISSTNGLNGKMVIVTDGDFPVNGEGQQSRSLQPDNVNLMANAIDYMSDDSGLIQLRAKTIKHRPLDQLEDSTKTVLKIVNFSLPIILILLIGLFRWQRKRLIKLKRMEDYYV